ncbi:TonB-dependent receptor [Sphingomonas sp. ASY06-1R]|uniref:TonB-dependent receptor n=1 Tax=Sphingomonas sp. ASY06-1R TaxID=3445771 RepID=UPI003FA1CEBF
MQIRFLLSVAVAALLTPAVQADTSAPPQDEGEVVVTASPFARNSDDTPTIVEKVDRESILTTGGASVTDALANLPGISSTGFAAGASRPIIRGMDATRVRVLENGTSSSDVSDIGPDHGIPIDPLAAQSIEVVRGPATLRYGSQAIGGVVNILNNRVPMALPTQPLSAEFTGSYGTAADVGQTSLLADAKIGDFALHADGFYRHAGDYDMPLGTQDNSYSHNHGGALGGSYFFGDSHVGAGLTQYNADYGIPSDTTHIVMKQTKATTRNSFDLGSGLFKTLNIDASYANYQHREEEPDGTVDTTFRNKEWDGRAELLAGPLGPLRDSAVGVEVQRRRFSAVGDDSSYLFPTLTQSEAAYLFTTLPVSSNFNLEASGRIEHVHVNGTPASNTATSVNFTPASAAIGALYTVSPALKFGVTFSSTGRAPAQTELFARGGHDGPNTFETGDPNLKIERANSLEGTMRVRSGGFRFDGSVYSTWFHNYIYGDLTGRTCDDDGQCVVGDGNDLRELNYRQQGAHFRGAEGEATYKLFNAGDGALEVKAQGDYTRATLDGGGNVPRIPPYRIGGGLTWTSTPVDAGFLLLYAGRQDKFGAFDTPTPHYYELNAQVAWRPFPSHPGIQLAVVGQNLTNDVQRFATALNKDQVVMPGRNIRFVLKIANF